jgi:ubiquinone/menaquinone biosynthesis C-methylase UbiE
MESIVDWNRRRQSMLLTTQRIKTCNPNFWDKCAFDFNHNSIHMQDLTKDQLRKMNLTPEQTVLEIGAGNGRITIPLSKKVKHVTAVEPSKNMLAFLRENIQKENITNVSYINKPWEQVNQESVHAHDMVLASFSLFMFDIAKNLQKMDALAKKCVYLFLSASNWIDKEIQEIIYDRKTPSVLSDHTYIYNILLQLDIRANLQTWKYKLKRTYSNYDDAIKRFMDLYNISPEKKGLIRKYLQEKIVEKKEGLILEQTKQVAMIWWIKTP